MRDGTIGHNQNVNGGSAEGGGVLNKGYFEMSGGSIEYNIEGGNTGGAGVLNMNTGTFKFSDGTIKGNMAVSGSSNNGRKAGGGVYNNGIMYIYGNAVIGDDEATEIATAANHSNTAVGEGGGIYVAENGKLYMGFSDYTSETVNTPVKWNKGIYYNYSESGGGGLGFATGSSVVINMNSGTIANNGAAKKGGAACISSNAFTISGTATIPATKIPKPEDPAEDDGTRQSIFINGGSLNIASSLSHIKNGELYLIPKDNETSTSTATGYSTYKPLIALTSAATASGLTIADVKDKFVIEPFTNPKTGIITNWTIDNSGTVAQNLSTFYVSSVSKGGSDSNTGLSSALPLLSIAAAVEKMNDSTKDYTIILNTVDGELTEPQVIADPVGGKIKAHSIKIEGSKASGLSDTNSVAAGIPKDIINANLGATQEGSALTINTTVPVYVELW